MELKQVGDLYLTLSDLEQELQSIYRNSEHAELKMARDSVRAARLALVRYTAASTNSSVEAACTKMGQLFST